MTNPLPDLEPAALEAAARAIAGPSLDSDSPQSIADAAIRAYLAARSVPEAGKAVVPKIWGSVGELAIEWIGANGQVIISISKDGTGYAMRRSDMFTPGKHDVLEEPERAAEEISAAVAALASPAPSGAASELTAAVEAGIAFGYDPATGFVHANDGGAPASCIFYVPKDEPAPSGAEPPTESRNEEFGFVEFINQDVPYIAREMDGHVAILHDMETRAVIGYRVYDPAKEQAVAPAEEIARLDLATAILKQLTALSAGSCSCGVKSPDIHWHDAGCRYRLAQEIRENVEALEEQRADQWRHRRDADGSRDVARAACDAMRTERDASEAEASDLRKERDLALEELGRVIVACPPGMRTSPASDGVKLLRDANRKLHRRAQLSEAINQSVEGILSSWCSVLFGPDGKKTPRYYEHHLFGIALGDIVAQRKKLTARALSERKEGQDGLWPNWGDSPNGFDGPGGAE